MKKAIHILKLLALLLLTAGPSACRDAAVELDDASLGSLLRPFAVKAAALDFERIDVSWSGTAGAFRLEYAADEAFADDVRVIEPVEGNRCTVGALEEATNYYFRVKSLSDRPEVASSEYSAVAAARTLVEPKIPNVRAVSEMEYTLTPWSITCTVTMSWGNAETVPEAITEVRVTPAGGGDTLLFPVSEEEAAAQCIVFSEGVLTDTEYTLELYAGRKMRGSCTHRTVPGPVPALHVAPELDFSSDDVRIVATARWDLYYIAPEELAELLVERKGSETPEQRIPVTAADLAAGSATITDLAPAAAYVVRLTDRQGAEIASDSFTTPEIPGADVLIVRPGADLTAILADKQRTQERIYLVPGDYSITANTVVDRNLEIYSDDPSRTTVTMTKYLQPEGTFEQLVLRNLRLDCSTYLIYSNKDCDIDLLRIENCVVDLNSASTASSALFVSLKGATAQQVLHRYEVDRSIVFANPAQVQNIVYNSTSGSIGTFERLTLSNSTFASCARGLVYVINTADVPCEVVLENCTLYNVGTGGGNGLIDIRLQGTANLSRRSVALRNSALWFGSTKGYKWLQFAGSSEGQYIPKAQIECSNCYYFATQTPTFGSSAYNIADRMTSYLGAPADLWENPQSDPSAAGASFRIKDQTVRAAQEANETTLGDPRWENNTNER